MTAFDLAIEARGSGRDEAMSSAEALAHGGEGVDFDGAVLVGQSPAIAKDVVIYFSIKP